MAPHPGPSQDQLKRKVKPNRIDDIRMSHMAIEGEQPAVKMHELHE